MAGGVEAVMRKGSPSGKRPVTAPALRPQPRTLDSGASRAFESAGKATPEPALNPLADQTIAPVSEDELHAELARLRAEVAGLIERAERAEALADHDVLTPALNRRGFMTVLARNLAYCRRHGVEAALLYLDLDGFKGINDVLGHEVGDRLLREVALALKRGMRRGDLVARVGGDEFVALLHDCRLAEDARHVADALRAGILALNESGRFAARIDASIGSACFPDHGQSPRMLLRHADGAMYSAKAARR